jgi:RNA polymerase sigma factor (sigma-70 family)
LDAVSDPGWRNDVKDWEREEEWTALMRAGLTGNSEAYKQFLVSITPYLRAAARARCRRMGALDGDAEDVVQETLLAIHLKRATWNSSRPIGPWISVILQHKIIDALRRKGRRTSVPIEDVMDELSVETPSEGFALSDIDTMLGTLKRRQQDIVRSISLDGKSVHETAHRLDMSEGAVRVALHRALKTLALLYRSKSI